MLKRVIAWLLGHLRIEVTKGRMERFLNLALQAGIYLWNVERRGDSMHVSLTLGDFFALRPVARGSRARVRIIRRGGFPFAVGRAKRRPLWIAGLLACMAFLFWAAGHIWIVDVKVTGPKNLDRRAVEAVAAEAGLRIGVWKGNIDMDRVEQHLQNRLGEISMAVIRVQGTRAVIEVVEKAAQRVPGQIGCANLVARKPGVIEEVVPFQGEPVVKKGDIVKAGDLLVECSFKIWKDGRPSVVPGTKKPPRETTVRTLVAQAMVRARISYSRYREVPLVVEQEVPTGRKATQWVLNWKDKSIILRGQQGIPFARAQTSRKTYALPSWRNWLPPVELVMVNASEVEVRQERISAETAVEQAKAQFSDQLRWILGPSDELLSPILTKVVEQHADRIGVQLTVETLEEIASPRQGVPVPDPAPTQPESRP